MRENRPLQRREVVLSISHPKSRTPSKEDICSQIGSLFKVRKELVIVSGCSTRFGTHETKCKVRIYESPEMLREIERDFVVKRKTGEEVRKKKARRVRKKERKEKAKIFGTMRRHLKKAEKRAQK